MIVETLLTGRVTIGPTTPGSSRVKTVVTSRAQFVHERHEEAAEPFGMDRGRTKAVESIDHQARNLPLADRGQQSLGEAVEIVLHRRLPDEDERLRRLRLAQIESKLVRLTQ